MDPTCRATAETAQMALARTVRELDAEKRVRRLIPGKRYLGDGAYVQSAGWGTCINLTAENGIEVLHQITLEPEIWRALLTYMTDLEAGVRALMKEKETDKQEATS